MHSVYEPSSLSTAYSTIYTTGSPAQNWQSGPWRSPRDTSLPCSTLPCIRHPILHAPCAEMGWASRTGSSTWGTSLPCHVTHPQIPSSGECALAATPLSLLPTEVAIMTLQDHPELWALLSLLPSKQDMHTLACDLKSAWRSRSSGGSNWRYWASE